MRYFPPHKLLVLNSRLKLQIFEKEVPKKKPQGCPMTRMPRNEGESSHQTALAGKRQGIRHFLVMYHKARWCPLFIAVAGSSRLSDLAALSMNKNVCLPERN